MIPRESNKGYMAKIGRCVDTRVRNKTRIVIRRFRTHKLLLLEVSPSEQLVWSAFANRQCGLLALTKVKQEAIHIRSNPKTSTGIRPWKMNSLRNGCEDRSLLQGLLIASRSKWRQLGERQNFTSSHYVEIFSPGYRKLFKVIIVFITPNLQDGRRCCINPCHKQKRITWGVRYSCA